MLLLSTALVPGACAKDLAVIATKGTIASMELAELAKVCKAQTNRWPDGKPVTVILRRPDSPDMKIVVEKVYGLTPQSVKDLIAAANHGRNNRPAIILANSDEEVISKVQSLPGAIGFVDVYSINSAVTVLKIGGKLPLEPGYPLHEK